MIPLQRVEVSPAPNVSRSLFRRSVRAGLMWPRRIRNYTQMAEDNVDFVAEE